MRKIHQAIAAAALGAAVFPMAASAAPFVTVSLETNTGATSVTGVTVGEVISYEVVYTFASPLPVVNTTAPVTTMSTLNTATDGVASVRFNIEQTGTPQDIVNFATAATLPSSWQGLSNNPGSTANNGLGSNDLLGVAATWATNGKNGGTQAGTIVATGTFTVTQANGTSTLTPGYLSPNATDGGTSQIAGALRINNGVKAIGAATSNSDPYFGYAGLTLIAGGTASTISISPASGTTLFPTNTVTVTNTASSGADTVTLSGLSVTQGLNGTFSQSGLTNNSTIAPNNGNEVGTIAFNQAGLLNGITVAGNLAFSAHGTAGPATNGTQNVSDPLSAAVSGNVATANTSGDGVTFGPALTATLAAGTSLAGISSNTSVSQGNGVVGTTATFLAGTTTAESTTISESWRIATTAEKVGTPPVLSDVLDVTGIPNANQPGGFVYVIEMSYVPADLGSISPLTLNLGELVGGVWNLAVANDVGGPQTRFINTWQNSGAGLTVGDFGVDTLNHDVWAVLDHDSILAVIPEPASVGLLSVGALSLLARRRRNRA